MYLHVPADLQIFWIQSESEKAMRRRMEKMIFFPIVSVVVVVGVGVGVGVYIYLDILVTEECISGEG